MRSKKPYRYRAGFTLVEMLYATVLVAIALISFVSAQTSSVKLSMKADDMYKATLLAQAKLTEFERKILKEGFDAVGAKTRGEFDKTLFPGFAWVVEIKNTGLDLLVGGAQKEIDKSNEQNPGQSLQQGGGQDDIMKIANQFLNQSIKLVECSVSWGPEKKRRTVTLETYLAKLDISIASLQQLGQGKP